jgi:hypothetical protein
LSLSTLIGQEVLEDLSGDHRQVGRFAIHMP